MTSVTRREFLTGCSAAIAAMAGAKLNLTVFGSALEEPNQQILVNIFLRGGCDALNIIPPIAGDDRGYYEAARPNLKIGTSGEGSAIPLNSQFGIHPAAASLADLYQANKLAVVQAVGLHEDTRSHFDAMEYIESGTPGYKGSNNGWITRHLLSADKLSGDPLIPVVALGTQRPTSLQGNLDTLVVSRLDRFQLSYGHWKWREAQRFSLRKLYNGSSAVQVAGLEALNALDIIELQDFSGYVPANGAVYPDGSFGDQLKSLAQIIKLQLGLRIVTIDLGGWDTHRSQGDGAGGYFAGLLGQLADGLSAFYTDLDTQYTKRLTVSVMSEFGRRFRQNADRGTDHGHGCIMLILGGEVNGGLYGQWPGLHNDQLYDGADLAVTTDYRQVLSEILIRRYENPNLGIVFPGYKDYAPLGIVLGPDIPPNYEGWPNPPGTEHTYMPLIRARF
ncbi:MAG: DUF1501 domain-containing protein [Candidatus Promineifilaceae bacterium]|nr:DUF1501 domain-containing protein [Candidatus Promineifilaceae bacterium]